MGLSPYQEAILDWARNGSGNAVVDAKAGTGKTFTLVQLLRVIQGKIQFLAFNKHIADELEKKVPMHVSVSTTNSFGNMILRSSRKGLKFDRFKTWNVFQSVTGKDKDLYIKVRNQVTQVVSLLKASFDGKDVADVGELLDKHGIMFPRNVKDPVALCNDTFWKCVHTDGIIDFDDQIFYPVYMKLEIYPWDWVLVDEAQDMNPVQQILIQMMLGEKGRLVAVGDPHQAIYGFRGADPDSIPNIIKRFNAQVLPLNLCYRCPKSVIEEAKEIVPEIEWCESTGEGMVTHFDDYDKWDKEWPQPKDLVLCRTTAPLVSECLRLIRMGKRAAVKGRDIGEGLMKMYDQVVGPAGQFLEPSQIRQMLEQYRIQQMHALREKPESLKVMVNDQIDTLIAILDYIDEQQAASMQTAFEKGAQLGSAGAEGMVLIDGATRIRANALAEFNMETVINKIFAEDSTDGVLFCSIHRSKGLEFDRVHIIRPDLLPHPKCTEGWQHVQEMNLKYVAITRALKELVWVHGERKRRDF